jgi:hypothetical protein
MNIFVGTWNVGNHEPDRLFDWIPTSGFDLIFIGAQESKFKAKSESKEGHDEEDDVDDDKSSSEEDSPKSPFSPFKRASSPEPVEDDEDLPDAEFAPSHDSPWLEVLKAHFGSGFTCLMSRTMGQVEGALFCPNENVSNIDQVRSSSKATGLLGIGSNKGGVAISCTYGGTRLLFITAHLAAHQKKTNLRNGQFLRLMRAFSVGLQQSDPELAYLDALNQHHITFLCGDLNYRCDFGNPRKKASKQVMNTYNHHIKDGDLLPLLGTDQLTAQRVQGKTCGPFQEAPILFRPTFKIMKPKSVARHLAENPSFCVIDPKTHLAYSTRAPAWTDRVLWFSTGLAVTATKYTSVESMRSSDHLPVFATFQVSLLPRFSSPLVLRELGTVALALSAALHPSINNPETKCLELQLRSGCLQTSAKCSLQPAGSGTFITPNSMQLTCAVTDPAALAGSFLYFDVRVENHSRKSQAHKRSTSLGQASLLLREVMFHEPVNVSVCLTLYGKPAGQLSLTLQFLAPQAAETVDDLELSKHGTHF